MAGIGEALDQGIITLQNLLDQALGGQPTPPPDAQPDDPNANQTPTPPPADPNLQDWGDDAAGPGVPNAPGPEPSPTPDDQAGPGVPNAPGPDTGAAPPDDMAGPGVPNAPGGDTGTPSGQGGIGSDAGATGGSPDLTPNAGFGGWGSGGIGSDAAASGGAGEVTPTFSDLLASAFNNLGNLLIPPASAMDMGTLPPITVTPEETPIKETPNLGPTREGLPEGTVITPPGMGGEEAPDFPVPPVTRGEDLPDITPPTGSPSPVGDTSGPSPDEAFPSIPTPPVTRGEDLPAPSAAGAEGGGGAGTGGGGGVMPSFDGGGEANSGGYPGGGAGDTGNIISDIDPGLSVDPGTQTAQNRPRQQPPNVPTQPGWQPIEIPQQHQSDLDYLEQHGGHNTVMPPGARAPWARPRNLEQNVPPSHQTPNYQLMQPDLAARLRAAGEAYTRETGRQPEYGIPPGQNPAFPQGNAGEMSRGNDVQQYYWDTRAGRGPVAPPQGAAGGRGSSHLEGRAMDITSGDFRDWLFRNNNAANFGLHRPVFNRTGRDAGHTEAIPGWTGRLPGAGGAANVPTAPNTGAYQYGTRQRAPIPVPMPQPRPEGAPTAADIQAQRDAAALAAANREAIRRGLMNPDGTPGPNARTTSQPPTVPLPQPRPEGAPLPYSGGGIGSDAARAPNQPEAFPRDPYFNPGDYRGGYPPLPYSGGGIGSDAARAPNQGEAYPRDPYFNPSDYQGTYPSVADTLAAEAARRAREALESSRSGGGIGSDAVAAPNQTYPYSGGGIGSDAARAPNQGEAYPRDPYFNPGDYQGTYPPLPYSGGGIGSDAARAPNQWPLTDPDLTGMQPQPLYVPNRPYDPSMDQPLPGNPYTDPRYSGGGIGSDAARSPLLSDPVVTSDGTVVDPRTLVDPSKAIETTKVPTPKPETKTAPQPRPAPTPRYTPPAPVYRAPAPRPAPRPAPAPGTLGSGIRYFVPGVGIVSQFGAGIAPYAGPDTYSNVQRVYPPPRYYGGPKGGLSR